MIVPGVGFIPGITNNGESFNPGILNGHGGTIGPGVGIGPGGVYDLVPRPPPGASEWIEWTLNDVPTGIIGYSADSLDYEVQAKKNGRDVSTGRQLSRLGQFGILDIGLSALNTATQGTPFENYTAVASDGYDLWNAGSNVRGLWSNSQASTGGTGASQATLTNSLTGSVAQTARLAALLNVGVAVVEGTFSAVDTVRNTFASFNSNRSTTERGEALIEGNASLGSTLMAAGVVAVAIPDGKL